MKRKAKDKILSDFKQNKFILYAKKDEKIQSSSGKNQTICLIKRTFAESRFLS